MAERLTKLTAAHQRQVEAVIEEHGAFIEAVATRCAPARDLVPDIVQEVHVRLCQSLHSFDGRSQLRTWLFAITRNTAVNAYRQENRYERGREKLAAHTVDEVVDIEADVIAEDDHERRRQLMGRAIDALTPRQRQAVRNILAPSGVSVNGEKTARCRARDRMRRWVRAHREDPDD